MAFGGAVDDVVLNKTYAAGFATVEAKRRYSPPAFVKCSKEVVIGAPAKSAISSSLVERANLSMRRGDAPLHAPDELFSKKLENHMHAVSFYFMVYNFVKIHGSIKTTPAMEAGVTDFLWSMEDVALMADTNS